MKKTLLWFVISLFVIGVVAFILFTSEDKTNTTTNNANVNTSTNRANTTLNTNSSNNANAALQLPSQENRLISVTSSGFVPSSVTITQGSTVVWKNDSNSVVYVAPDNHPSHLKYSGVWDDDGSGQIDPGEQYSFTFNESGTYSYHDHLNSTKTGTIIVE